MNPLLPPTNRELLTLFLDRFAIGEKDPVSLLTEVATAFAQVPYENLTKIIKDAELGHGQMARRAPAEVLQNHRDWGTGGTCFSLTASLLHLVRSLGWEAEPILADRKYGDNTHCALLVWLEGHPHLLDPGYLLVRPIPLDMSREQRIPTAFNEIILKPLDCGNKLELWTVQQGNRTYRLTFKTAPVDAGEFLRAWDASFQWDMMQYPLVTKVSGEQQLYLQGHRFQVRNHQSVHRREVSEEELIRIITRDLKIDPSIAKRALTVLNRKGESHG